MRLFTRLSVFAILLPAVVFAQAPASGPAPAPASSVVVGLMHAIHATNNVDKTLAFYTEVFGLSAQVAPFTNPGVPLLTDSPGVTLRVAMMRIPGQGFNFELTEFSNTERHPAQPDIADPGAPHMKFFVRDLAPVLAAAKRLNAPMITRGGQPVSLTAADGHTSRIIFFRDPDGYIVEAIQQGEAAPGGAGSNVVGSIIGETVSDMDTAMKFWHDILGVEAKENRQFASEAPALQQLLGVPKRAQIRLMGGVIPGSTARIQFMEITGVPRKPFSLRVPDPGASGMAIRVAKIEELLPQLKARGVRVLSKDGALVHWSDTVRNVFVKDPDGLNLELVGDLAAPQTR